MATTNKNMMINKSFAAADVSHCNTSSLTYYEVGIYEEYEDNKVLASYRSKENAEKHLQRLQARKQELIDELMKYPMVDDGWNHLDIFTNGSYKWGNSFDDIDSGIIHATVSYVEAIKEGLSEDKVERERTYSDFYMRERTIEFDD